MEMLKEQNYAGFEKLWKSPALMENLSNLNTESITLTSG